METQPSSMSPPSPLAPPPQPAKKGLGTAAKVGIGCGGLILLIIVGFVVIGFIFGPKMKKFAEDAQQNPTRATATMMVTASVGAMEIVVEDDAHKRYTLKDKKTGTLTTVYWDEKTKAPGVIEGDFSAIPVGQPATGSDVSSQPSSGVVK